MADTCPSRFLLALKIETEGDEDDDYKGKRKRKRQIKTHSLKIVCIVFWGRYAICYCTQMLLA